MTKLITNEKQLLSTLLQDVIPATKKLHFLVGYFYFSGFHEVAKEVKNKEMRILVGLEVEKRLQSTIAEINEKNLEENNGNSQTRMRQDYYEKFVEIFNDTDFFDTPEQQEAFKIFLRKIRDGSLKIKKTDDPNHAKIYLFEFEDDRGGTSPGNVLTGSSNLTYSGLSGRQEFNVLLQDEQEYQDSKEIFDRMWEDATDIVKPELLDEFEERVIKNIWHEKSAKPYHVFLRILKEYFEIEEDGEIKFPQQITKGKYSDLKYQKDAIREAISKIKKHNGVIISDVVGLGKSIVASTIAANLNLRTIIICPPAMEYDWEEYMSQFNLKGELYTSGKTEEAMNRELRNNHDKFIIIDEAHKYRNQKTNAYGHLYQLCQGEKVALLSATPFNNKPSDIFSLIKLFQIPYASSIQTVENLGEEFHKLVASYKDVNKMRREGELTEDEKSQRIKKISERIRDIIEPVIIRRSRVDLKNIDKYREDLKRQNFKLNEVKPPGELTYNLRENEELYKETFEAIYEDFEGARYMPSHYLDQRKEFKNKIKEEFGGEEQLLLQSQRNLANFMKRHLISRFESSVRAFKISLDRMINDAEKIKRYYEELEFIPVYKEGELPDVEIMEELPPEEAEREKDEILEELDDLEDEGLEKISSDEIAKTKFMPKLNSDINLLKGIREKWFGDPEVPQRNMFSNDYKLEDFTGFLQEKLEENPDRKIVVFSESADTVDYLHEELEKRDYRVFKFSSRNANKTKRQVVRRNFDASLDNHAWQDDYDILIATDTLSEGINLNRAGIVVNYDIPYNPTRVIQRVGRINRISEKIYNELEIYNYFPTETGEEEIGKKEISTLKISMMTEILGTDVKVLTEEEDIKSFYQEKIDEYAGEKESWKTKYLNILDSADEEDLETAEQIPHRTRIQRQERKSKSGVLIFGKAENDARFVLAENEEDVHPLTAKQSLSLLEANPDESSADVSEEFQNLYEEGKRHLYKGSSIHPRKDRGKRETIERITWLKKNVPSEEIYLENLLILTRDLDGLTDGYEKLIRDKEITEENAQDIVQELKDEIKPDSIQKTIDRAEDIQSTDKSLILIEELV